MTLCSAITTNGPIVKKGGEFVTMAPQQVAKKPNSKVILLGAYYKYGTYKCYSPIFLDCTVLIIEKFLRKSEQYV